MYKIRRISCEQLNEFIESELDLDKKYGREKDNDNFLYRREKIKETIYGLYYDHRLIGFCIADRALDYIYQYYISKFERRKRHGLRFLFKLGLCSLEVRNDNYGAIRLYRKYGMVENIDEPSYVTMKMFKPHTRRYKVF
jgi:hypothetical protein